MLTSEEINKLLSLKPEPPDQELSVSDDGTYILRRGERVWVCHSALTVWQARAVQVRLSYDERDNFKLFKQRLDAGEYIPIGYGVLYVWKCANCIEPDKCRWRKLAEMRKKADAEWARNVWEAGGLLLYE